MCSYSRWYWIQKYHSLAGRSENQTLQNWRTGKSKEYPKLRLAQTLWKGETDLPLYMYICLFVCLNELIPSSSSCPSLLYINTCMLAVPPRCELSIQCSGKTGDCWLAAGSCCSFWIWRQWYDYYLFESITSGYTPL